MLFLRLPNQIALSKGDKKQVEAGEKIHLRKLRMKLTVNKTEIANISYSWNFAFNLLLIAVTKVD